MPMLYPEDEYIKCSCGSKAFVEELTTAFKKEKLRGETVYVRVPSVKRIRCMDCGKVQTVSHQIVDGI